jgi:hypothetical protein
MKVLHSLLPMYDTERGGNRKLTVLFANQLLAISLLVVSAIHQVSVK